VARGFRLNIMRGWHSWSPIRVATEADTRTALTSNFYSRGIVCPERLETEQGTSLAPKQLRMDRFGNYLGDELASQAKAQSRHRPALRESNDTAAADLWSCVRDRI
jgi:hypothetical protein